MYSELKQRVLEANLKLPKYGLVTFRGPGLASTIKMLRGCQEMSGDG